MKSGASSEAAVVVCPSENPQRMTMKIAVLPGDGIGPEIVAAGGQGVGRAAPGFGLKIEMETAPIGGAAYDARRSVARSDPEARARSRCRVARRRRRPAVRHAATPTAPGAGLLRIRKELNLFANLRPALLYPELATASTLKPEVVSGLDIMIVRELTGDIYFGQPRGMRTLPNGERDGFNTMLYGESEIRRWRACGFEAARRSAARSCARWTRPTCWKPPSCGAK